ncbi:hypothetical protein GCM10023165_12350 [Variovorax defluvii]|uniref:Uncharacterized protein n=1 Tax=Variovorax defluvii TaxID=913761 RepID=A0ABP8H864_9BURK
MVLFHAHCLLRPLAALPRPKLLLLAKRPTRVAEIFARGDAWPRTVETLRAPSLVAAKKQSLEIFRREVRR